VTDFFAAIEQSPLSVWVREDLYAFFWILIVHGLGMAFLVGGGLAVSLRTMGLAGSARLDRFAGFFPAMWLGLALAVASGLLLLAGYPAKALTNPVFAVKAVLLIAAGLSTREIARRFFPSAERGETLPGWSQWVGALSCVLWLAGVTAGKFLPYTHHLLTVS